MLNDEILNSVLNRFYKGEKFITFEIQPEPGLRNSLNELKNRGLIKIEGSFYILTDKGYDTIEYKAPDLSINVQGHYIAGNVENSTLNTDNSNYKKPVINSATNTEPKTSIIEFLSWIIGIIVGLIGIYEFLIKK